LDRLFLDIQFLHVVFNQVLLNQLVIFLILNLPKNFAEAIHFRFPDFFLRSIELLHRFYEDIIFPFSLNKMNGTLIWCRNLLLAFSVLLTLVPVTFILNALLVGIGAILSAKPTPLPVVKVAFVNHLSFEILVPTKSIKFSIFEHSSINEFFCLQYPIAIEVSAVELAGVDFLFVTCEEILAVASHLTINPLSFVPLS
jgi:hypothetical protein